MQRALCIAGLDICDARMAADAGLAPCPLESEITGHEATATAFSIELGHRLTLTVMPNSDGTVTVVRTAGGIAGVSSRIRVGGRRRAGRSSKRAGRSGSPHAIQGARAWEFPNQAAADVSSSSTPRSTARAGTRFQPAWHSVEGSDEVATALGIAAGGEGHKERFDLVGGAASGQGAVGARLTFDRAGSSPSTGACPPTDPSCSSRSRPSKGLGKQEWLAEITLGPGRAARDRVPSRVRRASWTARSPRPSIGWICAIPTTARSRRRCSAMKLPWGDRERRIAAVAARIASHGTVERTVSASKTTPKACPGPPRAAGSSAAAYKRIKVTRALVSASARVGGFERRRQDCQVRPGDARRPRSRARRGCRRGRRRRRRASARRVPNSCSRTSRPCWRRCATASS